MQKPSENVFASNCHGPIHCEMVFVEEKNAQAAAWEVSSECRWHKS